MSYGIYDPAPELTEEGTAPVIYVSATEPWSRAEAEALANDLHPDNESGETKVVRVVFWMR